MTFDILTLTNPKSPQAEAYRTLRTNIQFSAVENQLKTLLVTSSQKSEGKSTTVCNLGVAFAQVEKKVLIIDCDLRRPKIHRYFELSNTCGLSNYLTSGIEVESVIFSTKEGVDVIPSGTIPPNPAELLNSSKFKQTLEQLRDNYDMIILDSPPIGLVTDSGVIANKVDGTLFVVKSHHIDQRLAINSMKLLNNAGAKVIGTVLVAIPADNKGYYGYQQYSYEEESIRVKKKKRGRKDKK